MLTLFQRYVLTLLLLGSPIALSACADPYAPLLSGLYVSTEGCVSFLHFWRPRV